MPIKATVMRRVRKVKIHHV